MKGKQFNEIQLCNKYKFYSITDYMKNICEQMFLGNMADAKKLFLQMEDKLIITFMADVMVNNSVFYLDKMQKVLLINWLTERK